MQIETRFKKRVLADLEKTFPDAYVLKTQERARKGVPDLFICLHGKFIAIELKAPGEKPEPLQEVILSEIRLAGGLALWTCPAEWLNQLRILKENPGLNSFIVDQLVGGSTGWNYLMLWGIFLRGSLIWVAYQCRLNGYFFPLILSLFLGGLHLWADVPSFKGDLVGYVRTLQMGWSSLDAILLPLLTLLFFRHPVGPKFKQRVRWILVGLCAFSSLAIFTPYFGYAFSNLALASCLSVSLLPIVWGQFQKYLPIQIAGTLLVIACVYFSHEQIGWALLGVLGIGLIYTRSPLLACTLSGITVAAISPFWPRFYPHLETRLAVWPLMIGEVQTQAPFFGMGLGSSWYSVRYLQAMPGNTSKHMEAFLQAHNDFIQIFYELGWTGLIAAILALGRLLFLAIPQIDLLLTLLCWILAACFHYPLHEPLTALGVILTVYLIVK